MRSPRIPAVFSFSLNRFTVFVVVLLFAVISGKWSSEHLLPWEVRLGGTILVVAGAVQFVRLGWLRNLEWRVQRWGSTSSISRPAACAAFATLVSAALAYLILEPFPHVEDEASYYFQARVFANGNLFAPAPPFPEFFPSSWVLVHEGRWFSIFPPGWPLLLAIGLTAGVPALVNPLLAGLCIFVMYLLIREMHDAKLAAWAVLLCSVSPFFVFMSASFMSHTALLLFATLCTLCHVKAMRGPHRMAWFLAGGLAAGCALLVRPLDAVVIWSAQAFYALWAEQRRPVKGLLLSASGLMLAAGLYLVYNRALVGWWFQAPVKVMSPAFRMGFGDDIGVNWDTFDTPGHNPWRALINLNFNAAVMSQDLFGWPLSSLLFAVVFLVFGRKNAAHRLSAIIVGAVVVAYGLFWYHGVCFGARFYFCLLPQLLTFTIEGIREVPRTLARYLSWPAPLLQRGVVASVLLSCAFAWLVYVPKVSLLGPYYDHRDINSSVYDFVSREGITSGVVFVKAPRSDFFGPAFSANELPLGKGKIVYAFDKGAANERLADLFPGRAVYRFSYQNEENPYEASLGWLADRVVGNRAQEEP